MVTLTWLGQAGFVFEVRGLRVLVDPFLSDHPSRLFAPPSSAPYVQEIDWLFSTHGHIDHFDLALIERVAIESPGVRICVPSSLAAAAEAATGGPGSVLPAQPGDRLAIGPADARVTVVPAYHALDASGPYGPGSDGLGRAQFVGYVFEFDELTVYHSGDTVLFPELLAILRAHAIDIAILPINGRDYFREQAGIVGNLDAAEAATFAAAIGASTLVPMHWDLFAGNTVRPSGVVDIVQDRALDLHVVIPTRWKPLTFGPSVRDAPVAAQNSSHRPEEGIS